MKNLNISAILFFFSITVTCGNLMAKNNSGTESSKKTGSGMKRYGIEKACIEYEIKGMQNGTEILYFDNWGAREAKFTHIEIKVGPISQKTNTVTYLEGTMTYTVDLDKNTGTKAENPMLQALEGEDVAEVGEQMLKNMGGKKIGKEKFLGKTCDVWEIKNLRSKSWVWKGITLKNETNMMGMKVSIKATKITYSFDKKKLDRPTHIKYKDMGEMMNKFKEFRKQN